MGAKREEDRVKIHKVWPTSDGFEALVEGSRLYLVRVGRTVECSCPDFVYRRGRAGEYCKHVRALLDHLVEEERYWRS